MAGVLLILIIIGAIPYHLYYQEEKKKDVYRIKVIDTLNGEQYFINRVNGINDKYHYSSRPEVALTHHSFEEADYVAKLFGGREHSKMIIEKRVFSIWGSQYYEISVE